ncbi:urea active transporter [Sesbania bispinosa]|nr:urea active transporter [Sesbania bispinosa]
MPLDYIMRQLFKIKIGRIVMCRFGEENYDFSSKDGLVRGDDDEPRVLTYQRPEMDPSW